MTGYKIEGDQVYVHTAGDRISDIVLANSPPMHPRLTSSSVEIEFKELNPKSVEFELDGYRPAKVELGGMGKGGRWQISFDGGMDELVADEAGSLSLELPAKASVSLSRN